MYIVFRPFSVNSTSICIPKAQILRNITPLVPIPPRLRESWAPGSRFGRRMRWSSVWSETSMIGTNAGIRCATGQEAFGRFSSPELARERLTNIRSSRDSVVIAS